MLGSPQATHAIYMDYMIKLLLFLSFLDKNIEKLPCRQLYGIVIQCRNIITGQTCVHSEHHLHIEERVLCELRRAFGFRLCPWEYYLSPLGLCPLVCKTSIIL